jgi:hypothetical protein
MMVLLGGRKRRFRVCSWMLVLHSSFRLDLRVVAWCAVALFASVLVDDQGYVFGDTAYASEFFAYVVAVVSKCAACFGDHAYGYLLEHVFRNVVDLVFFGGIGVYVRYFFGLSRSLCRR